MARPPPVPPDDLWRAVRLSRMPGVTLGEASRRMGVPLAALRRARKERPGWLDRDDIILGALSRNGQDVEGEVGDLRLLASWLDYVDKDGSTAESVARDLERLAAEGRLALEGGRYRLLQPWP